MNEWKLKKTADLLGENLNGHHDSQRFLAAMDVIESEIYNHHLYKINLNHHLINDIDTA